MKKSIRLFLEGSIQPMFYHPYVKEQADSLGLKGYIRQLEDGRVEVFLEGDMNVVAQMIELCKQGPYNTRVRNVEQKEERYQDFKDFKILRI